MSRFVLVPRQQLPTPRLPPQYLLFINHINGDTHAPLLNTKKLAPSPTPPAPLLVFKITPLKSTLILSNSLSSSSLKPPFANNPTTNFKL